MIKQKINLFFFSLFSFIILCTSEILGNIGVKNIFQDMSEDELAAQVQQGADLMDYMENQATPEERKAFEEAMTEMFNQLSPEDLEEINAIAEAVDGKINIHERKEPKPEPVKENKKKTDKIKTDNSVKEILKAINNIIDTIMRKVDSDLLLTDYLSSHSIKSSIALLQRLISLLESKQNIKRLSNKKDKENQKLIDELKDFRKKLEEQEKEFHVDDSFGASSKKSYKENVQKLNDIIEIFNHGFEHIMPEMEKFIRKYEAESKELAALYEKLKAASAKHAKLSQKRQGSRPAKATRSRHVQNSQQPAQQINNSYPGGYDDYDPYMEDYYRNLKKDRNRNKKPQAKKGNSKKRNPISHKKSQSEEDRMFDEIIDEIEEYLEAYDEKDLAKAIAFHQSATQQHPKFAAAIPVASGTPGAPLVPPKTADRKKNLIAFSQKSLQYLEQFEEKRNEIMESNLGSLADTLHNCQQKISKLDLPQILKLKGNKSYKEILKRASEYAAISDSFISNSKKAEQDNAAIIDLDYKHIETAATTAAKKADLAKLDQFLAQVQAEYKNMHKGNRALYRKLQDTADVFERSVRSAERRRKRKKKPGARKEKNRDKELEDNIMKRMKSNKPSATK